MDAQGWTHVVAAATRAPSIHNTQPWLFDASSDRLEIRLDTGRSLPVLDPTGRQQVISCAAAVEFAAIALRAGGAEAEVQVLPDPGDPALLARIAVGGRREVSATDRALAEAIGRRHTERAPFLPRGVPAELIAQLQAEAGSLGVWVKPITDPDDELATVSLLSRAEDTEQRDPAYMAELEQWVRTDPTSPDGVPVQAVPAADPATRPSNWLIRDFLAGERASGERASGQSGGSAVPAADAPPPAVERPAVLLMGTAGDDRAAWVQAGRALGRLLLSATAAGLATSPLTQALDWPATRTRLGLRLSLVGHPQMLLRLGYAASPGQPTGRRPVAEVLRHRP
jgi:nitroreductase